LANLAAKLAMVVRNTLVFRSIMLFYFPTQYSFQGLSSLTQINGGRDVVVVTLGVAALAGELGVATHGAVDAGARVVTAALWLVFKFHFQSRIELTSSRTMKILVSINQVT
jgi:hypothetical protein